MNSLDPFADIDFTQFWCWETVDADTVPATNAAGWTRSLRTFGPNFKLAYHMYFCFTMIVNKENTDSNKVETFRDIATQTKMDATTQHYYKISWTTVDDLRSTPEQEIPRETARSHNGAGVEYQRR